MKIIKLFYQIIRQLEANYKPIRINFEQIFIYNDLVT